MTTFISELAAKARAFFKDHNTAPEFIVVGLDVFEAVLRWHREERAFYKMVKRVGPDAGPNTQFYHGVEAALIPIPTTILVSGHVADDFIGEPDVWPGHEPGVF